MRFQVVPPCGGHQAGFSQGRRVLTVSSRAPVWGASCFQYKEETYQRVSSRAPVWGASLTLGWISIIWGFQVVPPCGGHHKGLALAFISSEFQVVPPCGGHPAAYIIVGTRTLVSSRAPVWGASFFAPSRGHPYKFQVVPPCGGHPADVGFVFAGSSVSSRAPVWGASCYL